MAENEKDDVQKKVDLALHRTLLASERTVTAWIRTGLAAMVAGLAAARFLTSDGPRWLGMTIALALIVSGGILYIVALWRFYRDRKRFGAKERIAPSWLIGIITAALLVVSFLSLLLVL